MVDMPLELDEVDIAILESLVKDVKNDHRRIDPMWAFS